MRKILRNTLVTGGMTLVALAPAATAFAATAPQRAAAVPASTAQATCTQDQAQDQIRLHLRDGTGLRHPAASQTKVGTATAAYQHRSGPMDGTGPRAAPALDGSGNQWHPWSVR
ncbi:MAG TPA: hypothetical protein VMU75_12050 [Acidimicrobiales bacterium]|nr:hypothetical protein [Acidimicrobiales bacterium]